LILLSQFLPESLLFNYGQVVASSCRPVTLSCPVSEFLVPGSGSVMPLNQHFAPSRLVASFPSLVPWLFWHITFAAFPLSFPPLPSPTC